LFSTSSDGGVVRQRLSSYRPRTDQSNSSASIKPWLLRNASFHWPNLCLSRKSEIKLSRYIARCLKFDRFSPYRNSNSSNSVTLLSISSCYRPWKPRCPNVNVHVKASLEITIVELCYYENRNPVSSQRIRGYLVEWPSYPWDPRWYCSKKLLQESILLKSSHVSCLPMLPPEIVPRVNLESRVLSQRDFKPEFASLKPGISPALSRMRPLCHRQF
jgi:hypothetical protein